LLDPPDRLLLQSYGVLTVTNPYWVALYKPVTVWPLSSAVICFQRISSPCALRLPAAALGVHPAKVLKRGCSRAMRRGGSR
jgi:hypothetical protein